MASTALNSRILEAMVTSRPETVTSTSPLNAQDVPATYIAQYTATLEDFARRNAAMIDGGSSLSGGDENTTEDEEGSYDEANGGQKRSASSPLDSAKKRRKQSKPNKIGGSECSGEGEEPEKEDRLERVSDSERLDENTSMNHPRISSSPVRCPYCDLSMTSHTDLRQHIAEQHIERMMNEEELMMRQAQISARQKLLEHHDQQRQIQYQQKFMHDALRFQEQAAREREALFEQQQRKQNQAQRDTDQKSNFKDNSNKDREEGESGPLNLSNTRWENHSTHSQEPQRSPITPLPASIPMPPSFSDGRFNLPGLSPFAPPHFLLPFMQPNGREPGLANSPHNNYGSGGLRIFNLEAFCELCNKEFCNKYFLKTHKANKHGIFTDDPSCSPMPPTPPTPLGPSTPIGSTASLLNPLLHSPITPTSMGASPYAGAFLAANLGNLGPLRPPLPVSLHQNTKPYNGTSKNDSSGSSKSGIINLDAYCELCQKEFCNKYFLKRHKLKIHNVNIEVTIKTPKNSSAIDRPEGWCDACRRDIGSKSSLNVHKLNVHGPHIINNMTTSASDVSPRPSLDMKHLNSFPMKLNNGEIMQKPNFSPWDSIREKEAMENQFGRNLFNNLSQHDNEMLAKQNNLNNMNNCNKSEAEKIMTNNKILPPIFSFADAMTSESLYMSNAKPTKEIPLMSPEFEHPHKMGVGVDSIESKENSQIKAEFKNSTDTTDMDVPKSDENSVIGSQMPILKPQIESHTDLSTPKSCPTTEDRPPLLTKEQMSMHSNTEFDETHESAMNTSDPPRTPGGVSNSTDDSSREAGFIARVGQPAIVQAPPGTKFTHEQLQKLGVVNPDAFCELCCKEFCNKYFLRTHRIKRHNIYTPEYSERSKHHYKEPNPINLVKIFEKQEMELQRPNMGQEIKFDCDICRKPFPNSYLLHMHKYCFHGLGQESSLQDSLPPLPQHIIPPEHLRQLALQAHHQKMQNHQELLRRQKDLENEEHHAIQMMQEQQRQNNASEKAVAHAKMIEEEQERERYIENHIQKQVELDSERSDISFKDETKFVLPENCEMKEEEVKEIKSPQMSPSLQENNNVPTNGETDTSQELMKLQSMIFGLDRPQESDSVVCKICQKEIGNKYFLRAHMMTEHGFLLQDEVGSNDLSHSSKNQMERNEAIPSPFNGSNSDNQAYCEICKKDFFSRFILQQHMISAHGTFMQQPGSTSFLDRIRAEVEGRGDDRKPQSVSRSFCDICQKELCNKYFMKTHMMRMHKINIENDNSGGVTCDICNKDLCSKYFLKVHRQNSHGLVEDMRDPKDFKDGMFAKRKDSDDNMEDMSAVEICPLCQRKFKDAKWLQTHLTQDHGEEGKEKWKEIESSYPQIDAQSKTNPSCSICGSVQPDLISLHLHLIKQHGSNLMNEEGLDSEHKNLQCSSCSFVCRSQALLAAHERSHSPMLPLSLQMSLPSSNQLQCHICSNILPNIESFQQHLLGHHLQGIFDPLLSKKDETGSDVEQKVSNGKVNGHSTPSTKKPTRWRCRKCSSRYKTRSECLMHIFSKHSRKRQTLTSFSCQQSWRHKTYKCNKCTVSHRRLGDLLNHMRANHSANSKQSKPGKIPSVEGDAKPVDSSSDFIMQRFLINRERVTSEGSSSDGEDDIIPSFVSLPVNKTVLRTLTMSFTLTPAQ